MVQSKPDIGQNKIHFQCRLLMLNFIKIHAVVSQMKCVNKETRFIHGAQ
jgi:hypothetical protein